jgi:5-amino-6-(5-phosphoribosylamino)uracil reductase
VRRLLPTARAVDLADAYAGLDPPADWVALGMVGSLDGAVAVDGTSGGLGGEGDRSAFRALRALGDVVVVGLGTAAAESYRPTWEARHVTARAARGQPPLPRLAMVTGSGRVPTDLRALEDPARPPLVVTTSTGATEARPRVAGRAEVVVVPATGDGSVDLTAAIRILADHGLRRVVCEGGPTLNNAMLTAGVVDELFVTIAPVLVGGGTGIVGPALPDGVHELQLHELRVHGSELVCRYRWRGPRAR